MQTVILPGHSEKNREWADLVSVKINVEGQVRPIFWDHWLDPSQLFYSSDHNYPYFTEFNNYLTS